MITMIDVLVYYSRSVIAKEIADFSRNRWIALQCKQISRDGRPIIVRYFKEKPLIIQNAREVYRLLKTFKRLKPRTFYASANVYNDLSTKEAVLDYFDNVIARTPTWDIDSEYSQWKYTLEVARLIVDELEKEGLSKSVYLKWSGNGIHVHVHEKAFSDEIYTRIKPIDIGFSVVEYILRKISDKIYLINQKYGLTNPIKVENLMDPQRIFTAPLSLHKTLDVACICFKPDEIDNFDISWTNPEKPRHNPDWRKYIKGEGDELAERAYKEVGPYIFKTKVRRRENSTEKRIFAPKLKEKEKIERKAFEIEFKVGLEDLRFNPQPPPLKGGREFSKGPMEAFYKVEDILSLFAMGKITIDHAIRALNYAKFAIIPYQGYPRDIREKIDELYSDAVNILMRLRTPNNVKKWLLSHGQPRKTIKRLDEFFG